MYCLSCGMPMSDAGGIARCACGGAWVTDAQLVEMEQEMRGDLTELPWLHRGDGGRACRVCSATMEEVALVGIALERCAAHGIWFDANELAAVLSRADWLDDAPAHAGKVIDAPRDADLEHANLRTVGNRLGLVFFQLLQSALHSRAWRR